MKVALGHRIQQGPWGGGNSFASSLAEALVQRGDSVVFALEEPDIDLILVVDPRSRNPNLAFTPGQVWRYLAKHPNCLAVHRVNECDERKGTRMMNFRLRLANYVADHTVFIGSWLAGLNLWRRESAFSVLLNGADARVFNSTGGAAWTGSEPLRLVTHHWGAHRFKGFDVYDHVDDMLDNDVWRKKLVVTYIGNLPAGHAFRNIRHLAPLSGSGLADELRRHHAYITASLNEPAGMHHIEGALCGLPLLYRNSGALPEYCQGFGEMFEGPGDVEAAIERMTANLAVHRQALAGYRRTADNMARDYLDLFDRLLAQRASLVKARRLWRNPLAALLVQIPL